MRISATLIDQWLRFRTNEYAKESELIASIKGVFIPNRKMECGSSFDQIVQEPAKYRVADTYVCDGIEWPGGILDEKCLPLFNNITTWQPKEIAHYTINRTPVNVVAKVDGLEADGIVEVKTTWSGFDYEKYYSAHQWRHYLLNFDAKWIRYHVFCWTEPVKGPFKLHDVETFTLYPYDRMKAECLETLGELVEYIQSKNLEQYVADNHPRLLRRTA